MLNKKTLEEMKKRYVGKWVHLQAPRFPVLICNDGLEIVDLDELGWTLKKLEDDLNELEGDPGKYSRKENGEEFFVSYESGVVFSFI